jgi:hypothetical protein
MTRDETKIADARAAYDAALKERADAWYAALREASAQWSEDVTQANALPTVDEQCKAMIKAIRRHDKALAAADMAHRGRINETHEALLRATGFLKDDASSSDSA